MLRIVIVMMTCLALSGCRQSKQDQLEESLSKTRRILARERIRLSAIEKNIGNPELSNVQAALQRERTRLLSRIEKLKEDVAELEKKLAEPASQP